MKEKTNLNLMYEELVSKNNILKSLLTHLKCLTPISITD